jgi:hypothetical protein
MGDYNLAYRRVHTVIPGVSSYPTPRPNDYGALCIAALDALLDMATEILLEHDHGIQILETIDPSRK